MSASSRAKNKGLGLGVCTAIKAQAGSRTPSRPSTCKVGGKNDPISLLVPFEESGRKEPAGLTTCCDGSIVDDNTGANKEVPRGRPTGWDAGWEVSAAAAAASAVAEAERAEACGMPPPMPRRARWDAST
mmetsp:Transcript_556/g.1138  ORF Transcript_556/g.1138 Transcript_556/m.1138 type:complete len:130 (+) Transcript_556:245-634(+)